MTFTNTKLCWLILQITVPSHVLTSRDVPVSGRRFNNGLDFLLLPWTSAVRWTFVTLIKSMAYGGCGSYFKNIIFKVIMQNRN